jgi:hypothetical protein
MFWICAVMISEVDCREIWCELDVSGAEDSLPCRDFCEYGNKHKGSIKKGNFWSSWGTLSFWRTSLCNNTSYFMLQLLKINTPSSKSDSGISLIRELNAFCKKCDVIPPSIKDVLSSLQVFNFALPGDIVCRLSLFCVQSNLDHLSPTAEQYLFDRKAFCNPIQRFVPGGISAAPSLTQTWLILDVNSYWRSDASAGRTAAARLIWDAVSLTKATKYRE